MGSSKKGAGRTNGSKAFPSVLMKQLELQGLRLPGQEGGFIVDSLAQPPHFTKAVTGVPRGENGLPRVMVPPGKELEPRSLTSQRSVSSRV